MSMTLIAHLAADAASFTAHDGDGARSFETPWHRAVLRIEDAAGNVVRSVEAFADGRLDVRSEGEDPHAPVVKAEERQPVEPEHEPQS